MSDNRRITNLTGSDSRLPSKMAMFTLPDSPPRPSLASVCVPLVDSETGYKIGEIHLDERAHDVIYRRSLQQMPRFIVNMNGSTREITEIFIRWEHPPQDA